MSRKILLASGCSFTQHQSSSNFDPSTFMDFPRWPEKLANLLDMECVNVGQSGFGNHKISSNIFEYIMDNPNKDIGLICCLWSEFTRFPLIPIPDVPVIGPRPWFLMDNGIKKSANRKKRILMHNDLLEFAASSLVDPDIAGSDKQICDSLLQETIKENFRNFYLVESLSKKKNIPYLFFQGLPPFKSFKSPNREKVFEMSHIKITSDLWAPEIDDIFLYFKKYQHYFDIEKFIGWPLFGDGYNYDGALWKSFMAAPCPARGRDAGTGEFTDMGKNFYLQFEISEKDRHPNEKGHAVIARVFYDGVSKLYPELLE